MSDVRGGTARHLFSPRGTIGPRGYLAWGAALLLLEFGIDAALVALLFPDSSWSPWLYLTPLRWQNVYPLAAAWHWLLFGAVALPFLWIGVCLTLRRLRDAGMPGWPLALFVLPPFNWLLFVLLALVIPSREHPPEHLEAPTAALLDNRRALHVLVAKLLGFAILPRRTGCRSS